jgi:PhoH-like ATPase
MNFALNILADPNIFLVTLLGNHGTGKTLNAVASALRDVIDIKRYSRLFYTRLTVPIGEKIGFTPGDEGEKMEVWVGALHDALDFLEKGSVGKNGETPSQKEKSMTRQEVMRYIETPAMCFMRGRSLHDIVLIIDEAQNLDEDLMEDLVSRAGEGTKVIICGNLKQIDSPGVSATSSGLMKLINGFRDDPHVAHLTMKDCVRSYIAERICQLFHPEYTEEDS